MAFKKAKKSALVSPGDSPAHVAVERLVTMSSESNDWRVLNKTLEEIRQQVATMPSAELGTFVSIGLAQFSDAAREYESSRDAYLTAVLKELVKQKLDLSDDDFINMINWSLFSDMLGPTLTKIERAAKKRKVSESLRTRLHSLSSSQIGNTTAEENRYRKKIAKILGDEAPQIVIRVDPLEPWAKRLSNDLAQLDTKVSQLVAHAATASAGKPTKKWLDQVDKLRDDLPDDLLRSALIVWISGFDTPRETTNSDWQSEYFAPDPWSVVEPNADLMKGLIWLATRYADDELTRVLGRAGLTGQRKIPNHGPRSTKVTNAAIWALSQIDSQLAIGQLAILRSKVTNKAVQKQIDKAIEAVADRLNVPADEVEEMAVPTYGLTEVGKRIETLGDFTAELVVTGTTSTEIRWIKPDGKPQKTVPKAVKDNFADDLKELKAAAKDIQKMLPAQRDRIDLLHLKQKKWAYATWRERYLDHPLVGTLARRLIWTFDSGKLVDATWLDGQLVDAAGEAAEIPADATVSLWHPIGHNESAITAWRRFFENREIKQPFKQAHREVYLLTDAERTTNVYSNRYASHIIKQHQYNALCGVRGWKNQLRLCVDADYPPTYVELPEWNLRAEFWVEGVGDDYGVDTNESGVYLYLSTDQVRFYAIDADQVSAHAGGGGYSWGRWRGEAEPEPIPLNQIPPLVFSEIMRDVDLFVGVASVANDPNWQDGGPEGRYRDYWHDTSFGDLGATAQTRREILERLVPKLKIAERCSFDEKFLIVRGDKRTYKIHLGSSNILMEPNDQYLCIVPGRGAGPGDKVFLPFEGDQRLAVILSKAMMLAADTKITDPTILSQIGR